MSGLMTAVSISVSFSLKFKEKERCNHKLVHVHISNEPLDISPPSEVRQCGPQVTMLSGAFWSYFGPLSPPQQQMMAPRVPRVAAGHSVGRSLPGVGRNLAEVAQAAVGSTTGGDARCVAMDRVHLGLLIVRSWDVGVGPLLSPPMDQGPAARQVHGAQHCSGHARGRVDAAVRGGPLDVCQPQQLGIHEVPRPKVLVVAVAGGVAGQRVAAGVAGAAFISDLEKRETGRLQTNPTLCFYTKAIILPRLTKLQT